MTAQPPPDIIAAAQAAESQWGIPASISLAQWALESGWGKHIPPGSNNPFGVKAVAGQPSVTVRTEEYNSAGGIYYVNAAFRKYASIGLAFDDHARLLATSRYYASARKFLPDPEAFADALTGVYATNPAYGQMLIQIMRDSDLTRYDGSAA